MTDLLQACEMLQDREKYWHAGEDERTDFLRDMLEAKGYLVFDQHRSSVSAGGIRSGEMDLDIRLYPGVAWTALEALNLNGSSSSQIKYWNMHLKKLLDNYNEVGRSFLFQVSYVQCRKDAFHRIVNDFYEHLRFYSPPGFELMRRFVQVIPVGSGEAQHEFIRVAKCVYDCGGVMMTVYHFFVRIGEGITAAPAAPVIPKEKKTPQIQDEDQVVRYEYRVVILGDSEAGKSHLLARLKDPQMEPGAFSGDVTHGIDITQKSYSINECEVRVNYWDFGGQEILHSLQRLFLSKRALYVIVLNTRNDNQDAQADFWLRYVQTYASGAPVMLVLNKIDQNPRAALNMSLLRRRFRYTMDNCEVLRLSARDWSKKKFQEEFLNPLLTRIGKCLNRDCGFTARDVRIIDRLDQYKKDHQLIEFEVFRQLCEEEGLTVRKSRGVLAERLRHTGVLISFNTTIRMLLDPEWITRAIFILLEKQEALAESGMLSKNDIEDLYLDDADSAYQEEQVEFILQIMREKALSFPYKQNHSANEEDEFKEFIPMLCYREEPAEIDIMEQECNPVELQMHYNYLPPTVIHQLMVARIDDMDVTKAWGSGAIFRNDTGCTAIVRRDSNILTILVWGEETSYAIDYMDTLKKHIDQIGKMYLQIDTPAEVRIGYRVNGAIEYFNYNRLVNAKACNIQYTANSGNRHFRISVQDILDQTDRSEGRDVRELLRLIAAGCRELQMNQTYWFWESDVKKNGHIAPKMDENARNRLLRFKLEQSFAVKDQPQGGESSTGVSPGELDLWIGTDMDSPLAILEALNITGDDADSRKRWKEHLHRLVVNYNKPGYRCLVLVSYLNCPEEQMSGVQKVYNGLLKESTFEIYGGTQPFLDTEFLPNCPNLIHITRADYSGGAGNISVYHFLVHIPRYLGDR